MSQTGKGKTMALVLTISLLFTSTLLAANSTHNPPGANTGESLGFNVGVGLEKMTGDTAYSIGGSVTMADGSQGNMHFPLSKLEWPLDIQLVRIEAERMIGSVWRINGTIKKSLSNPADTMKDSDWGLNYLDGEPNTSTDDLDAYSESDIADFDALIWEIECSRTLLQRKTWNLYAGLGYQHQKFEYNGKLIQQTEYLRGTPVNVLNGDGNVGITYDITYKMTYIHVGGEYRVTPNFILTGSLSYSPWVNAADEDNHLLRNKVSIGDMDGTASMIDVMGRYNFDSPWFLEAGFNSTKIDVDGSHNQTIDGSALGTIEVKSESTQNSGYLKIGYKF